MTPMNVDQIAPEGCDAPADHLPSDSPHTKQEKRTAMGLQIGTNPDTGELSCPHLHARHEKQNSHVSEGAEMPPRLLVMPAVLTGDGPSSPPQLLYPALPRIVLQASYTSTFNRRKCE